MIPELFKDEREYSNVMRMLKGIAYEQTRGVSLVHGFSDRHKSDVDFMKAAEDFDNTVRKLDIKGANTSTLLSLDYSNGEYNLRLTSVHVPMDDKLNEQTIIWANKLSTEDIKDLVDKYRRFESARDAVPSKEKRSTITPAAAATQSPENAIVVAITTGKQSIFIEPILQQSKLTEINGQQPHKLTATVLDNCIKVVAGTGKDAISKYTTPEQFNALKTVFSLGLNHSQVVSYDHSKQPFLLFNNDAEFKKAYQRVSGEYNTFAKGRPQDGDYRVCRQANTLELSGRLQTLVSKASQALQNEAPKQENKEQQKVRYTK